jgi:hypothetical protein
MNEKNIALPVSVAATSARLASVARRVRSDRPADEGAAVSGGSELRMTTVAVSGSTATAASATRQLVTAVRSATPTRPTSPPTTSAET